MMYYRRRWRDEKACSDHDFFSGQISESFSFMKDTEQKLYWDSAYSIALALIDHFPDRNPEDVGLVELSELVESLPGFEDDSGLATERILLDIQISWYEELNS
jgi:FeS assembly protein IscX